jgi:hypothetical protein
MFPLHDQTRRRLCRWIFLISGLLPTFAVLAWATSINSAGHLADVRARLEMETGLAVRLTKVSYPRQDATLLEGLELADRETGETLLRMRLLEIVGDERALTLIASQPEIEIRGVDRLWSLIDNRLWRRAEAKQPALHLAASELTLHWAGGLQTLVDCNAQMDLSEAGNTATAVCRIANAKSSEPIKLRLERSGRSGQLATSMELDTAGTPLPCSLLAALCQRDNRLGAQSTLQGTIQATESPDGWNVEFAGALENVDLHTAVSDQFPHQLGGTAELKIRKATVHAGRLETAEGEIQAGPGVVSQSLLAPCSEASPITHPATSCPTKSWPPDSRSMPTDWRSTVDAATAIPAWCWIAKGENCCAKRPAARCPWWR